MDYRLDILKALSDETRLNIILLLLKGEKNVLNIVSNIKKSQPNISIALKKLQYAGILESRKEHNRVYYRLKDLERISNILELVKNAQKE
ncbi:winged helix-turn-helix transcriptional regulator [Candidatus Woesearchaeota archaeon]|nr:winged helix-turn-helix transcriptional regulator [Candidatus Woesearchaeota archaeon]